MVRRFIYNCSHPRSPLVPPLDSKVEIMARREIQRLVLHVAPNSMVNHRTVISYLIYLGPTTMIILHIIATIHLVSGE